LKLAHYLSPLAVGLISILCGCGGHGGDRTINSTKDGAALAYKVTWPAKSRVIPADTNRIVIKVLSPEHGRIGALIIDRPVTGAPSSGTLDNLLPGNGRIVVAEARRVSDPGTERITNPTDAQLAEGEVLASGSSSPIRLQPLSTAAVELELQANVPPIVDPGAYPSGSITVPDPDKPSVLITLNAVFNRSSGVPITGLTAADFDVIEDGIHRKVSSVDETGAGAATKVDIGFMIDTTSSMSEEIDGTKDSVVAFVQALAAKGLDVQVGGIAFGDDLRGTSNLSSDVGAFVNWVGTLDAFGGNDIPENDVDAIMAFLINQNWRPGAQRVIIVLTDAPTHVKEDSTGIAHYALDDVRTSLYNSGTVLYTISPGGGRAAVIGSSSVNKGQSPPKITRAGEPDISQIAAATGGKSYVMPANGALDLSTLPLVADLSHGYLIHYATVPTHSEHNVRLVVNQSGSPIADKYFTVTY
jgi:hypothetical protein